MEDYRQARKEYQRLQREILEKRAAEAGKRVRRVMKRMDRAPSLFRGARTRPINPAHEA